MRSGYNTVGISYNEGLRQYMLSIFNNMAIGLAISSVLSFIVGTSPELLGMFFGGPQKWLVMLAPLGIVMYLSWAIRSMTPAQARTWFYVYSAATGISLAFIFALFKMGSIFTLFFGTSAMFGAVSLYGYTTKRDLTQFGSFLFMGLMGLIITGLINLFVQSTVIATATSLIAVLLFAGLTAYDVQMLKDMYDRSYEGEREMLGIYGALQLYMNFINMFINLLMLFGDRK